MKSLLFASALSLLPLTSMGTDMSKAPNPATGAVAGATQKGSSAPGQNFGQGGYMVVSSPDSAKSPTTPASNPGQKWGYAPSSTDSGVTGGNVGSGGKGGAGSVGNSKAPKGSAADGNAVVVNPSTGNFTYTPTATAPKSASQGRPTGDTANDLKAPAPPK